MVSVITGLQPVLVVKSRRLDHHHKVQVFLQLCGVNFIRQVWVYVAIRRKRVETYSTLSSKNWRISSRHLFLFMEKWSYAFRIH